MAGAFKHRRPRDQKRWSSNAKARREAERFQAPFPGSPPAARKGRAAETRPPKGNTPDRR